MAKLHIWDFNTLTLSGTQLTSTQPQSLTLDDIMNPTWQVLVEFVQLHTHSNISQHFDFLTTSRRWGGQAGGAWRGHSVRLQTGRDKWSVHTWGLFFSLSLKFYLSHKIEKNKNKNKNPTAHVYRVAFSRVFQNESLTVLTAWYFRMLTVHRITYLKVTVIELFVRGTSWTIYIFFFFFT